MATVREVMTTFGRYVLGATLGEGGAGRVFAARDESDSPCAVKVLAPERITTERRRRFKNEIMFGVRNDHPNVVRILDHGVTDIKGTPCPFYVMPLFHGSLRNHMQQLDDPVRTLKAFDQILSGVEAAHLLGVVHRDLKPENVLVDSKADLLVVADFGIADFTAEDLYTAVETKDGTRLANFEYAAPEQRTRGTGVSSLADIFSLGLILNEVFTGRVPHGTSYKTVAEVSAEYAWIDTLVTEMISQDPARRPATVDHVKQGLVRHQQQFVQRQRLDEVTRSVVPTTEIVDPLAHTPPRLIDFEWAGDNLVLILDRDVNETWVKALHAMGNYTSLLGKGPQSFRFSGSRAYVPAREKEVQPVIDHFKEWLPKATTKYKEFLEMEANAAERRLRAKLEAEREELERQQRVRGSIKI